MGNFSKQTFLLVGNSTEGPVSSGTSAVCPEPCAPCILRKSCSLPQVRSSKYGPGMGEGQGWHRGYLRESPAGPALEQQGAACSPPSPCWLGLGAPASTPPQPPNTAASCSSGSLSQQDQTPGGIKRNMESEEGKVVITLPALPDEGRGPSSRIPGAFETFPSPKSSSQKLPVH